MDTETESTVEFEMTLYVAATPEQVWEAITGDAGNRAVMWGSVLRGDLVPGSRYEYVGPGRDGDETVHVYGDVLQADAPRVLQLTEHPGATYRENHADLVSRMTWRIEPAGDALTRLTFTSDEWSEGHPARVEAGEVWPHLLSSFKSYLETGRALPAPESEPVPESASA
ncbi:SRPBCC domain-containing protein [Agromyces larvae]|uniref:SRPBCC domain-containing protein n=1 Tax=Agromyces larvae TaxID=2929802 RepID=A0ABY4C6A5_9MICO|nr:SRPBCC domain-containing protein [Agromyces larvae]UOE44260.1 SRPBCC domain-containing protein [Agromyces larvae]